MKEATSLMLAVQAPSSGEPDMASLKVSSTNKILIQITTYSFYVRLSGKNISLLQLKVYLKLKKLPLSILPEQEIANENTKKNPVDLQDVRTEETKRTCGLLCNVLAENSNMQVPPSYSNFRVSQIVPKFCTGADSNKMSIYTLQVLNSLFFQKYGYYLCRVPLMHT